MTLLPFIIPKSLHIHLEKIQITGTTVSEIVVHWTKLKHNFRHNCVQNRSKRMCACIEWFSDRIMSRGFKIVCVAFLLFPCSSPSPGLLLSPPLSCDQLYPLSLSLEKLGSLQIRTLTHSLSLQLSSPCADIEAFLSLYCIYAILKVRKFHIFCHLFSFSVELMFVWWFLGIMLNCCFDLVLITP